MDRHRELSVSQMSLLRALGLEGAVEAPPAPASRIRPRTAGRRRPTLVVLAIVAQLLLIWLAAMGVQARLACRDHAAPVGFPLRGYS